MQTVDRVVIGEFIKRGYHINGVVHVGANDGYEVQWYKELGIQHILCFEPLPTAAARFKERYPDVRLMPLALGNINGLAYINVTAGDGQGSSLLPDPPHGYGYDYVDILKVPIRRFEDWVRDGGAFNPAYYDCLVIDTQGAELDVLRGFANYLSGFKFLNIECSASPIYSGGAFAEDIVRYLARFGFIQQSKIVAHGDILFIHESVAKPIDILPIESVPSPIVKPPSGDKLNVGSGQRRFDTEHGWVNIDCISREGQVPDLVCNVGIDPLPYATNSLQLSVLHHVLEHFGCGEGLSMCREIYRTLRPGGSLIILLPDLKALSSRWLNGNIDDYIFFVNTYGAYMGAESDRHKWGYTPQSLIAFLNDCGKWSSIKPFDWRPIPGADIARDWWILGMEAVK